MRCPEPTLHSNGCSDRDPVRMPVGAACRSYTGARTANTATTHPEGIAPAPTLRAESEAIYAAAAAGILGAIYGLVVAFIARTCRSPTPPALSAFWPRSGRASPRPPSLAAGIRDHRLRADLRVDRGRHPLPRRHGPARIDRFPPRIRPRLRGEDTLIPSNACWEGASLPEQHRRSGG